MNNRPSFKLIITSIAITSAFCFVGFAFAQVPKIGASAEDVTDLKQEQAQKYRELGLGYQQMGNLEQALSFYQKAIAVYPYFAVAYNDLGVVYEGMGLLDRAEESYLKAIKINPAYASVYTNLALFYESQRNLEKAAFYWSKRAEVGTFGDPWQQKAVNRLRDIRMSLAGNPLTDEREKEVLGLMKEVAQDRKFNKIDENPAQAHFRKAKLNFDRGDITTALKEALDAEYLDQNNPEIVAFIEKAELMALTR